MIVGEVSGTIDGESIVSEAIVGGAIIGEVIIAGDGRCWSDDAAIGRGLQVLAVAEMSWAGKIMIWRRLLAFIAAATS